MNQTDIYITSIKKGLAGFNFFSIIIFSLLTLCFHTNAFATDYTYNGGIGNWSDASKWTPNGIPSTGDNITISSNSLTLDIDVTVNNVTMSANLSGSNTLSVAGTMTWSGGAVSASIIIQNTGTLNITGAVNTGNLTLNGTTNQTGGNLILTGNDIVDNNGTYNLSGGSINLNVGTTQFNNIGSFNINKDGTIISGIGTFDNNGTCTKTTGLGAIFIGTDFYNDGTFNHDFGNKLSFTRHLIQNGILTLNGNEELETESCTVNASFTLENGQLWDINATLTLNIDYTTSAIIDVANHLSGSGNLTINNTLTKSGQGNFFIPITISSGANFNHTYVNTTDVNEDLILKGTATQSSGTLRLGLGNTIHNSGTYNLTGGTLNLNNSTTLFNNTGIFNINVDGNRMFGFPLNASGWDISYNPNNVVLTITGPLPVELLNFSGEVKNNHISLLWTTTNETDHLGFEIQRSKNANQWESIGFVTNRNDTNTISEYFFNDFSPLPVFNYYRLKQVDTNGEFSFSKVISIQYSQSKYFRISPNPINSHFNIIGLEEGTFKIYNNVGRIIKHGFFLNSSINIENFPKGVYYIQLYSGTENYTKKIIKN